MHNYGYRGITTTVPAIAGTIERGNLDRMQRKGQRWVFNRPVNILINRTNGKETSITVLSHDGKALARLYPDAIF